MFKPCWNSFDLHSSVQNQHASIPQKKVKCFGDVSCTRLGEKKDWAIDLLVRWLMSRTLNTIIHQIRHQIRPRSWCPPCGRDNTALVISYLDTITNKLDFRKSTCVLCCCFQHEKIELILWQIDLMRVDFVAIDLVRIDLVTPIKSTVHQTVMFAPHCSLAP